MLTGILAKKPGLKVAGYGLAVGGYTASLVFQLGASSNRKKAQQTYNKAAGY
jgi:hypothetical protein